MKDEIILYQSDELPARIEARVENETVWLNLKQISMLFKKDKSVISRHIRNIFNEGELLESSVVAKNTTTAEDGKNYQVKYYNLDVVISVGYRVKSKQGTQFRIWANKVLKDHLLKGYEMKQRKIIRLKGYDYARMGDYFITIEPKNDKYDFSKIVDGKIVLNDIGKIIDEQWQWLVLQYDYIELDEYVIMPDHFHGIIRILPDKSKNQGAIRESPVQEQGRLPLYRIIGAFKTTSSKKIHISGYRNFKWKRSFHDRILRRDELQIKRKYIRNNPID